MIRVEHRARGIVWVTIDRPAARNAMTFAMWDELGSAARALDADESVRVIVFAGAGAEAFVAGTDINEFREFDAEAGIAYEERIERVMRALEAIRVPTIAAIGGACTGGGIAIAGTCDLRIGSPGTRVGIPIARTLGNVIALKNCLRLSRIIGIDAVKRLIFTARLLDAPAALGLGFLTDLADTDDGLHAHAQAAAEALVELAPLTLRATKEIARRIVAATDVPDDADLIRLCYGSADFRRGVAAFFAKERADWTGR